MKSGSCSGEKGSYLSLSSNTELAPPAEFGGNHCTWSEWAKAVGGVSDSSG